MKLYSSAAIAKILCLSERRIRQLRDEDIIHEYTDGLYDLVPIIQEYIKYLRHGSSSEGGTVDLNRERALLARAKRQNVEYDLALKEKNLHESSEVEVVMTTMLLNFRSRMMSIPNKTAPVLAQKTDKTEIHEILKKQINEALMELSDFDTAFRSIFENESCESTMESEE